MKTSPKSLELFFYRFIENVVRIQIDKFLQKTLITRMSYDALIQQNTSYWTAQCFYFPKENTIKNIFKNSNFRHTKENTF